VKIAILKDASKAKGCAFEEWNGSAHAVARCDRPPVVKFGGRNLCAEHAAYAVAVAPPADYFDANGRQVPTVPAFLKLMKRVNA
jgi:hypothetical protein